MKFFNFLREKIGNRGKTKKEQIQMVFSEIEDWIKKKKDESKNEEGKVIDIIQKKIGAFINEFREKLKIMMLVDVDSRKVEEDFKSVVKKSREKYIESAENFLNRLENLGENQLEKFAEDINQIFLEFNKSSQKNYEKVTILIGKEMADIKESLRIFSGELIEIFERNKKITTSLKTISLVESQLKQIENILKNSKEINENLLSLNKRITGKKEKEKEILGEVEKIKESENYLKNLEKQKNIKLLEEELEKELLSLRHMIDFKALANFFHLFEEQMSIVKAHRENFQIRFKRDNGKSIGALLEDAKLNNVAISEKIKEINNKEKEISQNKQEIIKDETIELYSDMTKILLEVGNLKNEIVWNEKKKEKLKADKEKLMGEIKEEIEKIGGMIKDF